MNEFSNTVQLIGFVGENPKIKDLKDHKKMATFSLATTQIFKDKEGVKKEKTDWHQLKAFGKVASLIEEFIKKGSKIIIKGSLRSSEYVGENEEQKYSYGVIVESIYFLDKKEE